MIFLLNSVIKATAILALAIVAARLLRKQSAAVRHCVLTTGVLSSALIPGVSLLVPSWDLKFPMFPESAVTTQSQLSLVAEPEFFPAPQFAPAGTSELSAPARSTKTLEAPAPAEPQEPSMPTVPAPAIPVRSLLQPAFLARGAVFIWITGIVLSLGVLLA